MAMTNQERVGKAMELLRAGLAPFVEREVQSAVKAGTVRMDAVRRFAEDPMLGNKPIAQWDVAGLLKLMWETWNDVFKRTLGFAERSLAARSEASRRAAGRFMDGVPARAGQSCARCPAPRRRASARRPR